MHQAVAKCFCTSRQQVSVGMQQQNIEAASDLANMTRSDIHFWRTGRIGSLVVEGDCILGHEAAGIVLQCGDAVKTLKPGEKLRTTESYQD